MPLSIYVGGLLSCLRETEHKAMAKRLQPIFREVVREVLQEMREMDREASSREAVVEMALSEVIAGRAGGVTPKKKEGSVG